MINLFLLGYVAEFSQHCCSIVFPEMSIIGRLLLLAAAIIVMCLSSSLYFCADLGVSTYDAVALIWSEKQGRIRFQYCRIICDSVLCAGGGPPVYCGQGGHLRRCRNRHCHYRVFHGTADRLFQPHRGASSAEHAIKTVCQRAAVAVTRQMFTVRSTKILAAPAGGPGRAGALPHKKRRPLCRIEAQRSGFDPEKEETRSTDEKKATAFAIAFFEPCGVISDVCLIE